MVVYQGKITQRSQQNGQEAAWVGLRVEHAPVLNTGRGARAEVQLGKAQSPRQANGPFASELRIPTPRQALYNESNCPRHLNLQFLYHTEGQEEDARARDHPTREWI